MYQKWRCFLDEFRTHHFKDIIKLSSRCKNYNFNGIVISKDVTQKYGIKSASKKIDDFFDINRELKARLKFLQEMYFEIEKDCKSPLSYLKNRLILCYYDFVCELKADTKESLLCEYMFDFPIGFKKEISDIYCFIEGVREEDVLKVDTRSIINAMEGVNKKTQKFFGFSIFKKEKSVIYILIKR